MIIGCFGFFALIGLIIWAFIIHPLMGAVALLAGAGLVIWNWSTLNVIGGLFLMAATIWGFQVHWILGVIFLIGSFFILGVDQTAKEEEEDKEQAIKNLQEQKNFEISHQFDGEKKQVLAIDEDAEKIAYLNGTDHRRIYPIREILDVQMTKDDKQVIKSSTGISTSGAILGGAIGGGVGAVIGGRRKKHRVEDRVERISLHIVVNDTNEPTIIFDLYKGSLSRNDSSVKGAYQKAEQLYDLLLVLRRQS
ncbi:hypothetical protein GCM10008986_14050 [Salinibacillus aidingensis]|uniref:Uncharacterized protein n=2 Tax=Salinibacillus aidingensis TaxID=237684 RepID=A0ABN1B3G0_9BACI